MTDYKINTPSKSKLFVKFVAGYFYNSLSTLQQQLLSILKTEPFGFTRNQICEQLKLPKYHLKWYQSGYGYRESDFYRSRTTVFNHLVKLEQIGFILRKKVYSGEVGNQPIYWYLKPIFFELLPNI